MLKALYMHFLWQLLLIASTPASAERYVFQDIGAEASLEEEKLGMNTTQRSNLALPSPDAAALREWVSQVPCGASKQVTAKWKELVFHVLNSGNIAAYAQVFSHMGEVGEAAGPALGIVGVVWNVNGMFANACPPRNLCAFTSGLLGTAVAGAGVAAAAGLMHAIPGGPLIAITIRVVGKCCKHYDSSVSEAILACIAADSELPSKSQLQALSHSKDPANWWAKYAMDTGADDSDEITVG